MHRRDDAEFGEAREVLRAQNLRVLDAPAGLADFSLIRRHGLQRVFVKIEDRAIRAIADGVGFDLHAAAKRFLEDRLQLCFFLGEIAGSLRRVRIRFQ